MANKMLIDATHPEETRVVALRGNRVEEFDFESAQRKQLRGNIYLAKVTRVEPSLQAAFVDYGGNRHGFLAFSEIHPDYYQIPVADRQALIEEEERAQRALDVEADHRAGRRRGPRGRGAERASDTMRSDPMAEDQPAAEAAETTADLAVADEAPIEEPVQEPPAESQPVEEAVSPPADALEAQDVPAESEPKLTENATEQNGNGAAGVEDAGEDEEVVESVGGADAMEEVPERTPRYRRQYKIQEVIKRRQVLLVQVVKEERGTKGAALTTYLSLAGRYSVLMPNTARGGGISRKITDMQDRRRLKEIAQELEVPEGMGVILRTAGASRTKTEVKRDFEYLLRMWETVRDLTLKSTAPKLVYEEGSLIKRSIRDLYNKDIEEIIVAGDEGYHEAKDFMRMLMPSHAKHVKPYKDNQPLFSRHGIESQLDAMFSPVVQLRSGGYIVLNQAEALVAIDVNSGRATREHHIEDTALKTNLEASEEIARQLRLRDLAGLIVIDFIDMDEKRNNRTVERRLKDSLKNDRARIQVGRISHFGLLEMSRQRIRTSVFESSTEKCPHCGGSGHVRSVASLALQLLRSLEETLIKGATHNLIVRTRPEVALYVLNHKRAHLRALEERFRITIAVSADAMVGGQQFMIERGEQMHTLEAAKAIAAQSDTRPAVVEEEPEEDEDELDDEEEDDATAEEGEPQEPQVGRGEGEEGSRRRRRRRRRARSGGIGGEPVSEPIPAQSEREEEGGDIAAATPVPGETRGDPRRRRRGRRGGRRNRREREGEFTPREAEGGMAPVRERPAPVFDDPQPVFQPEDFAPRPVEPSETAPMDAHEPAEPKRRSTVREPAPFLSSEPNISSEPNPAPPQPQPEPAPPASEEAENVDRPRRTGWWARRMGGGS
jgi:ribonuclease E